ncbi:MAG: adaptor protein MecA [Lachnospiraceae bacterium]|nr:adaptor protein MecA [Lachnospiraceae bacterium]
MKIEKINDNQIRCTLNANDLATRHINIQELAYGTEKMQRLFHEMTGFAGVHFGFDTEEIPLVIEAVPMPKESLLLFISKVNYPDELDARFSMFSDMPDDLDLFYPEDDDYMEEIPLGRDIVNAGEILSLTDDAKRDEAKKEDGTILPIDPSRFIRLYQASSLDALIALAHILRGYYLADNTLYHPKNNDYYLLLHIGEHTAEQFNKVCNVASEYATMRRITGGTSQYFAEHARPVIEHYALQTLAQIPKR